MSVNIQNSRSAAGPDLRLEHLPLRTEPASSEHVIATSIRPSSPQDHHAQGTTHTGVGRSQTHLVLEWTAEDCQQAVTALHAAMKGAGTSEWNVLRVLKNLSPEQRAEVEQVFNQAYPSVWGNLRRALNSELSGDLLQQSQELLDSAKGPHVNQWKALALHEAMKGGGTYEEEVYRILESNSFEDLNEIQKQFETQFSKYWGGGLRLALQNDFSEDTLARTLRILDLAALSSQNGLASGHQVSQAARDLHLAMKGSGTDEDAIFRVLETFNYKDIQSIESLFTHRYQEYWGGNLETALRDDLGGSDLKRALSSLQTALNAKMAADPQAVARQRLTYILKEGNDRSVRHQIGKAELDQASPAEKVLLMQKLLAGSTGDEDEMALLRILKHGDARQSSQLLEALDQKYLLSTVLDNIHDSEYDILLESLPAMVSSIAAVKALFRASSDQTDLRHKLMLHRVLDQARKGDYLHASLSEVKAANPMQAKVIEEALALSQRQSPLLIVAHRGGSPSVAENTMAAIEASLRHGVGALEIDVAMTRDGQLVLMHDLDPNGLVAQIRQWGFEPDKLYQPLVPNHDSQMRKPLAELSQAELNQHYAYVGPEGQEKHSIPELSEVLALFKSHADLEALYLDTKIPDGQPELQRKYAEKLSELIISAEQDLPDLRERLVLLNNNPENLAVLKAIMPPDQGFNFAYDREDLNRFAWLGLRGSDDVDFRSQSEGHSHISAGNPKSPVGQGYDDYLAAMQRARADIDRSGSGQKLMAWTLNDPLKIRELLAIGVDEVITDDPEGFQRLLHEMGLRE